jgi:acetyl-CoA carboxylase biotin carboxyl carrier protein
MKRVQATVTGTLRSYSVKTGDTVAVGQEVAVVESMKMLIPVLAEIAGSVRALAKRVDELIHEGETLIELD